MLGVESAFHFRTRKAFFEEALRVLKPGGRLALADLCGVDRRLAPKDRLAEFVGHSFWHRVYPRFADYACHRLHAPEVAARMSPVFRRMLVASLGAGRKLNPEAMDYVLASAHKPITAGTLAC